MEALYILVRLAGQRVAIRAEHVEAVVDIDAISPTPLVAPHVAGIAALRSRVITVIDGVAALGLGSMDRSGRARAVVVQIDGHGYGLMVEGVEDVLSIPGEIEPSTTNLGPG